MNRAGGDAHGGTTGALDAFALVCPHDGAALSRTGQTLGCAHGHAFDIARQGHANVLPVAHKASRDPGDSRAMVAARRKVLDGGGFEPVRDALIEHASVRGVAARGGTALDAGCGEGYYTAALAERWPALSVLGIDISRHAVRAAASRSRRTGWLVASNSRPPLAPGNADLIVSLFGFACWQAWADHQREGQGVLCIDPGPEHLIELRERIYPSVRRHPPPGDQAARVAGYRACGTHSLRVQRRGVPIEPLLAMTPHGHRAPPEARQRLIDDPPPVMTLEVVLRSWRRDA